MVNNNYVFITGYVYDLTFLYDNSILKNCSFRLSSYIIASSMTLKKMRILLNKTKYKNFNCAIKSNIIVTYIPSIIPLIP